MNTMIKIALFDENRYFDVFVEYAKGTPEDILIRIRVVNRGPDKARLQLLPTVWFRNTWSWGLDPHKPGLRRIDPYRDAEVIRINHTPYYGLRWLYCEDSPELLFTENETNMSRLYGVSNHTSHVKDSINDFIVVRIQQITKNRFAIETNERHVSPHRPFATRLPKLLVFRNSNIEYRPSRKGRKCNLTEIDVVLSLCCRKAH